MPKGVQINSISSFKDHVCYVSENLDFRWIVITRITSNPNLKPPFGIPRFRFKSSRLSLGVIIAAKKWTRISAKYFMLNSFIEVHAEFQPNESFQMTSKPSQILCTTMTRTVKTKTGFQNDTLTSLCVWLILSQLLFDWLTAPSGQHQLESPLLKLFLNQTKTKFLIFQPDFLSVILAIHY